MSAPPAPVLFREVQQFRQWWLQAIVLGASGLVIAVSAWEIVRQLVSGRPLREGLIPDAALAILGLVCIAIFGILLPLFFFSMRMITEIRPDGLYVRFFPFHRTFRHTPWENVAAFEAVAYRPIRDYGGWGIRYGAKGRAYNVSGNRGLRLSMTDGRRLMIGSARTEELRDAFASHWRLGEPLH